MKIHRTKLILSLLSVLMGLCLVYIGTMVIPHADGITPADAANLQRLVLIGVGFILLPPFFMLVAFIVRASQS